MEASNDHSRAVASDIRTGKAPKHPCTTTVKCIRLASGSCGYGWVHAALHEGRKPRCIRVTHRVVVAVAPAVYEMHSMSTGIGTGLLFF